MNHRPGWAVVLSLALMTAFHAGGCGKKEAFSSKEGGFSVEASSAPKQKMETVPTKDGPAAIHTLTFEMRNPAAEYWVVYIDYPASAVLQKGVDALLNEARDGSLYNVNGRLLEERNIALESYPGREIQYEGEAPEEGFYKSRIYLVKHRLYVVLVTIPRAGPSEQAERFLNSFRLL